MDDQLYTKCLSLAWYYRIIRYQWLYPSWYIS